MSDDKWPAEVDKSYDRVRILGQGAFGSVWLAKAKFEPSPSSTEAAACDDDDDDASFEEDGFDAPSPVTKSHHAYVAVKRIHASDASEIEYASREIDILSEIRHPNVVQCLGHYNMSDCRLVVLTLADGPNLQQLVDHGGALSTSLARLASRHLIAAVSYLHGRGVMHRDIKPENCILVKTNDAYLDMNRQDDWKAEDKFWDDKSIFDEKEWKVILVDFGFAKALATKDVGGGRRASVAQLFQKQASQHGLNQPNLNNEPLLISNRRFSFERRPIRAMSAVGTRSYAAPEVMKVREKSSADGALTTCVSDYGFISDSYSIGSTLKVLFTGVPADVTDVIAFISSNSSPLLIILSTLFSCGKKNNRRKRYKFLDEVPKPARDLIEKLMKTNVEERLAVPLARDEPWIRGGCSADDPLVMLPEGDIAVGNSDPVVCLKCSVHHED
jgi:serine/threonine protein kinase